MIASGVPIPSIARSNMTTVMASAASRPAANPPRSAFLLVINPEV
jgi:hypothetical protein